MSQHILFLFLGLGNGAVFAALPIPGLPVTVDLGGPMSFWPAFLLSLVVAAVFGLLLYFVVFRPLRSAPPVAKAVASIGVTVVMQGVLAQRVGTLPVVVDQILP